jgi:hypothetical protein
MSMGDRLVDIYKTVMLPALDNDQEAAMNASSGGVAQGNAAVANEQANAAATMDALKSGYGIATDPNASWNK